MPLSSWWQNVIFLGSYATFSWYMHQTPHAGRPEKYLLDTKNTWYDMTWWNYDGISDGIIPALVKPHSNFVHTICQIGEQRFNTTNTVIFLWREVVDIHDQLRLLPWGVKPLWWTALLKAQKFCINRKGLWRVICSLKQIALSDRLFQEIWLISIG